MVELSDKYTGLGGSDTFEHERYMVFDDAVWYSQPNK